MNAAGTCSEIDDSEESEVEWQTVSYSNTKRRYQSDSPVTTQKKFRSEQNEASTSSSNNRFAGLKVDDSNTVEADNSPKPPPLYIPNVCNVKEMNAHFSSVIAPTQYSYKALRDGQIRVMVKTITSYRSLVNYLKLKNISFHTFQTKQDKAYRVVIKNLHHSTNIDDIKIFIENLGHKVRNISNIKSHLTKQPLSMFFVDLEPNDNNKEIYDLKHINNAIIVVQPPMKTNNIPQCHRCQQYGHTKAYCNKPFRCVRCGANHITAECTKNINVPAICANCQESHPASYRGCIVHRELKKKLQSKLNTHHQRRVQIDPFINEVPQTHVSNNNSSFTPNLTYSDALRGNAVNENTIFKRIETLLEKQMELTTTLMNMMSVLCTKLCQ